MKSLCICLLSKSPFDNLATAKIPRRPVSLSENKVKELNVDQTKHILQIKKKISFIYTPKGFSKQENLRKP